MSFPETSKAISEYASSEIYGFGEHTKYSPSVGATGLLVGHETYDPSRHNPLAIDPLATMAMVTGEQQVRYVQPGKPLYWSVVVDASPRRESRAVSESRLAMADHIGTLLTEELNAGITDNAERHVVTKREQMAAKVGGLALDGGLVFIVSDFQGIDMPSARTAPMVAVKTDHFINRYMPDLGGRFALGAGYEIDTRVPEQRDAYTAAMQHTHEHRVAELERKGYFLAEAVTDPNQAQGYDMAAVDSSIATALRRAEKHNQ